MAKYSYLPQPVVQPLMPIERSVRLVVFVATELVSNRPMRAGVVVYARSALLHS